MTSLPFGNRPNIEMREIPDGREIIIPTERDYLGIGFLFVWLCGWAVGEIMAIFSLIATITGQGDAEAGVSTGFMLIWLAGWTVGGYFAIKMILNMLFGREIIRILPGKLILAKKIRNWGKEKEYAISQMSNLRVEPIIAPARGFSKKQKQLTLAFEYNGKTVQFGNLLNELEGEAIIALIRQSGKMKDDHEQREGQGIPQQRDQSPESDEELYFPD